MFDNIPPKKNGDLYVAYVYEIVNGVHGRSYIGCSTIGKHRMLKHFSDLNRGVHKNTMLQSDYRNAKRRAFSINILDTIESENKVFAFTKIHELERLHIKRLSPYYNSNGKKLNKQIRRQSEILTPPLSK